MTAAAASAIAVGEDFQVVLMAAAVGRICWLF